MEKKVPTGLLLSGGIDSTLLLALAYKNGIRMPTFTVVNSAKENSSGTEDGKYSRIAANIYKSDHHELPIDRNILNGFSDFIGSVDQPIGDSSYLLTSEICKHASGSVKVLLSGAGADELFGGYNRHWAFYKYLVNKPLMDLLLPLSRSAFRYLPDLPGLSRVRHLQNMEKMAKSHDRSPEAMWLNMISFHEFKGAHGEFSEKSPSNSWMTWALWHDRTNYLVSDVLALTDKASMLHGLEVRVPYLDDRIVNHLGTIDSRSLMKQGRKWILRQILIDNGGAKIANRSKEGFGLPLGNWFSDKKSAHLFEPLQKANAYIFEFFEKEKFDRIFSEHQSGKRDNGPLIWSILVLSHWLEGNF
ncbi:MAG: asparagine synthase C-terminal domain-containing protein [Cyclobacteriaceae bacterium]|nr:asparagine synthase C-terminal domain-containing protein [Cyclobacteriaceae bacterium]